MSQLTPEEWAKRRGSGGPLKRTCRERGRMVHLSCEAGMKPHKDDPEGPHIVPWIGPGYTRNIGRNKAKREKRTDSGTSAPSA